VGEGEKGKLGTSVSTTAEIHFSQASHSKNPQSLKFCGFYDKYGSGGFGVYDS